MQIATALSSFQNLYPRPGVTGTGFYLEPQTTRNKWMVVSLSWRIPNKELFGKTAMSISVSGSRTWASWLARFLTTTKSKTPLANLQRNPLHLEFTETCILSYTSECSCFKNLSGRHVAIVTENDASNWGKKQKACHFSDLKPVTIQVPSLGGNLSHSHHSHP